LKLLSDIMSHLATNMPRIASFEGSKGHGAPSDVFFCTRRKFGFNKKIRTKLLIVYVYFQPNSCNTHTDCELAGGTFLRQWRKVPPAHAQQVYLTYLH
jgi:hypothetical protein